MLWNSVLVGGNRFFCFARREAARAGLGLLLITLASTLAPQVSAAAFAEESGAARGTPLADVLNPDGTLQLTTGQSLTIDPTGYKMVSAPNAQPHFAPETLVNPGNENWASGFSVTGMLSDPNAIAFDSSGNLYVGGNFTTAGTCNVGCTYIAKWDGTTWSSLGTGMNAIVYALAVDSSGNVYAGGIFSTAGSCVSGCNGIAKWNGSAWSPVGVGVSGMLNTLAFDSSGNLYAGGNFGIPTSCGGGCNYIAKWNGSAWSALGAGMSAPVYAIAFDTGGNVYAGGAFTTVTNCPGGCSYIAKWNGTVWSALSGGMNYYVYALAVDSSGNLYAGGGFSIAGSCLSACYRIAKWNGTAWSALGSGIGNDVYAIALDGSGNLTVGGSFSSAGTCNPCNRVATWNGTTWSAIGKGLSAVVDALAYDSGGTLYAGGGVLAPGCGTCSYINKWNGSTWSTVGLQGNGIVNYVNTLGFDSAGNLYAGGDFTATGKCAVNCNFIAKWDGTAWTALGSGFDNSVFALAFDGGGNVYAGGNFTQICGNAACNSGNTTANYVAKWDGTAWSALGSGMNSTVYALAFGSGYLFAGGQFNQSCGNAACTSGNLTVNGIAKWDGSAWSVLSMGMNNTVRALVFRSGSLYAGGLFTTAGFCNPCNRIARWDGSNWNFLVGGVNNNVFSIAFDGSGNLYAGGAFTTAGTCTSGCRSIAKWNGTAWSALGYGTPGTPFALAADSAGNVYAAGSLTVICGNAACNSGNTTMNRIAKWDGAAWSSVGTGVNNQVNALAFESSGNLYLGGWFNTAGVITSNYIARWTAAVGNLIPTTGTYTFYQNNLPVTINVTTQGNLARINLQRVNTSYSGVPTTWQTGYYWSIDGWNSSGGTATGFMVDMTLPTPNFTPDSSSKLCRIVVNQDCNVASYTFTTVTRNNITAFSPWLAASSAPTASTLTQFSGHATGKQNVRLEWTTGSEVSLLGFNIYHAKKNKPWKKQNADLIPAQHPGEILGADYQFIDKKVKGKRQAHRYKLEILKTDGTGEWSDIVRP